jgi:hypothetical protein
MRTFLAISIIALMCLPAFGIEKTKSQPQQTQVSSAEEAPPQVGEPTRVRTRLKFGVSPENDVCYTMPSLQVAREPGSDSTRRVRQRTCTPSSQFQMKSIVQRGK